MPKALKEAGGVAAKVEQLVRPAIEELGLRLWDVRFEKEGTLWFLKVFIDRDEPLDTDTCEAASRAIDPILDEADPIAQSYCLEVGSPGLGRRLTRAAHYDAVRGQKIQVSLYAPGPNGQKEATGILQNLDGADLVLQTEQGERRIPLQDTAAVKLCDDEGLFGG